MWRSAVILVMLLLVSSAVLVAADLTPQELELDVSDGTSNANWHGQARFHSLHLALAGHSAFADRWLPDFDSGVALTYSDVQQAHSWFGYRDREGNDTIRAEWATLFLRRTWRGFAGAQPFAEIGTGPMWSNRRVPAATSRFNFNSELTAGLQLGPASHPLLLGWRFSHISNAGMASRNPGWNVFSLILGTKVRSFR